MNLPKLDKYDPLTDEEFLTLIRGMDSVTGTHNRGLGQAVARFSLENIRAIRKFDDASTRLTTRIYWLTWALVVLTIAMTALTALLWWKG